MPFEFATATRIVFGRGALATIGSAAAELGHRALVVTGASAAAARRVEPAVARLHEAGVHTERFAIAGEPTIEDVEGGVATAHDAGCDLVVGFGGGSAIDAAKAIAALLANGGAPLDYLEVIGDGRPLRRPSVPWIAVPTTAGTGAEVTRNAVLAAPERQVKASLRSPLMLARLAVVDPALTVGLPPAITAATGLDALTQLLEAYVSCRSSPLVDPLCLDGIARVSRSLRRAWSADEPAARDDMALASLFGGLALANAGLGAVHGIAAPLGGMCKAPHGQVCAALLAPVMAVNLRALRERGPDGPIDRYQTVARILTANPNATPDDGVVWVETLVAELGIPRLRAHGLREVDVDLLVEKAGAASSMKANPLPLTRDELRAIVAAAL